MTYIRPARLDKAYSNLNDTLAELDMSVFNQSAFQICLPHVFQEREVRGGG